VLCNMAHAMSQALSGATLRLFRPWNLPFSWPKHVIVAKKKKLRALLCEWHDRKLIKFSASPVV